MNELKWLIVGGCPRSGLGPQPIDCGHVSLDGKCRKPAERWSRPSTSRLGHEHFHCLHAKGHR